MRHFIFIACIFVVITIISFAILDKDNNKKIDNTDYIKYSDEPVKNIQTEITPYEDICVNLKTNTKALKSYNLAQYSEKHAQQILLNYINTYYKNDIEIMKKVYKSARDFNLDQIRAFEYDLNKDGSNEIIGIVIDQAIFGGTLGTNLFILQKNNGKYENISELFYSYSSEIITIMANTTNNYHDFQFRQEADVFSKSDIIQYDKNNGYRFVYLCQ